MMASFTRRSALTIIAGGGVAVSARGAFAEAKEGRAIYPVAVPVYQSQFVADRAGYFKDAGLDCKLIQGGSGVKTREIIASSQGDVGIGDVTHPMQLSNHGRAGRILMPTDTRSSSVMFIIRKDLKDQGITSLEALTQWKRPDGRKPIISVSSLGGTNHVWASYYMETMNLDDKVTWIGTGNVDTMMGSLKTKQVDVLVSSQSLLDDAQEQGWGALLFDGTDEAIWNKYIGGKIPVTCHFSIQSTIDKDPTKMQAYVTALWRATQWLKAHSPDEIYDMIEPYVGSTSRKANILEITALKKVADFDGTIDAAGFARGEKVWFREMTGIKPLTIAEVVSPGFVEAARKALKQDMSAMAPEAERIDVRGLSKTFQLAGTAIEAVRDVSFSVRRGEFVALLGPSGSGKSTVLNMIATLIRPSGGLIMIDGKPVIAGEATSGVGYVFQRDTLFPWRTVADNIGYGLQLAGVSPAERKERVAAGVAQAGLRGFEDAYPSALSGGMRQRAALMRTLVVEPQILLMDEPFGALDTHTKIDMHDVLLRIWEREQQTVLFVTHDLGEALTLADRIILFSARPGRIKDMFEVDFARPRDAVKVRETPRYAELFQHIWHSLGEEFAKGRRE